MTDTLAAELAARPYQPDPFPLLPRKSLGPRWDKALEILRQLYRPILGAICVLGLARQFLVAAPADRLDEMSLLILAGLAGALAGIRAAEMTMMRPR